MIHRDTKPGNDAADRSALAGILILILLLILAVLLCAGIPTLTVYGMTWAFYAAHP